MRRDHVCQRKVSFDRRIHHASKTRWQTHGLGDSDWHSGLGSDGEKVR